MLTLRQLHYFLNVAETGHFGQAAERCHISQPALSMQIQELEASLGIPLLERQRGKAQLTSEGREVFQRSREILQQVRDLEDWSHHHRQPLMGPLRLGVIPTVAPYLLHWVLPVLGDRYPALTLSLQESQTDTLLAALARGDLDVLLLALPVDGMEVSSMVLFDDPFLLAVPRNSPLADGRPIDAQTLANQNLLLLEEGHCLRDQALGFCRGAQPELIDRFGASSLGTLMQMVVYGHGVTLLPSIAASQEGRDERIRLLPFHAPVPRRTLGLAWRPSSPRTKDFEALGGLIQEAHSSSVSSI